MDYYQVKKDQYFTNLRLDMLPYLPERNELKVLDVGCSGGNTLCYLKEQGRISEAVGVDLFDLPGTNQRNKLIDRMIVADIQQKNLDLPENHFDVLFCGDVLEHLTDPWDILSYLKKFLLPGGILIVSLPNIREYTAMYKIFFKGDFAYASSGILDKTHFRFFCKKP